MTERTAGLGAIVEFLERLVTEFTWRRLTFVIGFLGAVILCVVIYESYTQSFALARLDRQLALCERLAQARERLTATGSKELISQIDCISGSLEALMRPKASVFELSPTIRKVAYASMPWLILSILMSLVSRKDKNSRTAVFGVISCALPFIGIAAMLPTFPQPWINEWLYPWISVVVVVIFLLAFQKAKARSQH